MGGGMMNEGTNWMPPLIVLGIGLIAGLVLALRMAKGKRAAAMHAARPSDDLEVRDLRVQRDLLLAQLRDLDDTAGKRSAEDLARARYALELEAARALRHLDRAEAVSRATAAKAPAPAPVQQGSSALAGALWGGGVVAFGAILFFVLQGQMAERSMGGSLTGNDISIRGPAAANGAQAPAPGQPAQPDPELEAFVARAQANPRDLDAQLDLAQAFLYRDRLIDVFQTVQTARAIDPDNPRALTYEAVVRQAMGQADQALQMLDQALAKDPTMAEAWVRRGLVAFDLSKWEAAVQSWEKALELRPDGREALEPVIAEAKLRMQGKATAMPSAPAPAAAAPAAAPVAAAPAAAPGDLQLVLDLDPALAGRIPAGTPIFISVRSAGVKAGPPAAAKRLSSSTFPLTVAIGAADTMMGQPIPASAYVEARIDADGNAMTKSPSDPSASADGVVPGKETRLLLRAGD